MVLSQEMTIIANNITKRYNRNVIFKDFSFQFDNKRISAILGPNGSGKSTLLRILSSQLEPDSGSLSYFDGKVLADKIFKHIGYVAPYIDIPEEFTFNELLSFQKKFKSSSLSNDDIIDKCHLLNFKDTCLKEFSSGMKQRAKLSLNLFFNHEIYLFDEPCSHLDKEGFAWFNANIQELKGNGTIVICSNNSDEYLHAEQFVDIQDFK